MDVVDLRQVAVEVAEFYEWTTDRVELEPGPEAKVRGEAHLIRQALFNLVDNALKFAPEGSPVVVSVGPYQDHCRLSVADRGPGIPAERQDFVVERFARLEESRSLPGSGLGLALVRAAAEAHRATLSFEDNRPGLVVHLDFPCSSGAVE